VQREIRMTGWYPMVDGARVPLLRLVDLGGGFRPELRLWWPTRYPTVLPGSGPGVQCTAAGDENPICLQTVAIPLQRDWNAFAQQLFDLGECRPPAVPTQTTNADGSVTGSVTGEAIDGGELLIQLFDRGSFRMYRCNAPDGLTGSSAHVREIYRFVYALERAAPRRP